jgi:hypothetical protein
VIAYIDSSAVLAPVLAQPLLEASTLPEVTRTFTSELTAVECRRAVDSLRLTGGYDDGQVATALERLRQAEETFSQIPVTSRVLEMASQPFGTVVRTLDAIHLAAALQLRTAAPGEEVLFITHDRQQGRAAFRLGFPVFGRGRPDLT